MNKKKKKIIIIVSIIFIVLLIAPMIFSYILYQKFFGIRYMSREDRIRKLEYFSGLQRDRYELTSNKGQKIVGYNYYFEDKEDIKGVIIFAHGIGGGGHNSYMDIIYTIAQHDYFIFAYDATGNDESEGKSVNGLPQGVIDLDHVISYVEQQDEFQGLPICLMGHSWGGYSVANALNEHPEVDCVISIAGFSKSSDLIEAQGTQMMGPVMHVLIPYFKVIDKVKFGKYSTDTGMDGFAKTEAKVMIIHGELDNTVPQDYGYDLYFEKYKNDPDFIFEYRKGCDHNNILNNNVIKDIIAFCDENMA